MDTESQSAYTMVTAILHGSERIADFAVTGPIRAAAEMLCGDWLDRMSREAGKSGSGRALPDEITMDLELVGCRGRSGEIFEGALAKNGIEHIIARTSPDSENCYCIFFSDDLDRAREALKNELTGKARAGMEKSPEKESIYRDFPPGYAEPETGY